jgi:hypothetical protein
VVVRVKMRELVEVEELEGGGGCLLIFLLQQMSSGNGPQISRDVCTREPVADVSEKGA